MSAFGVAYHFSVQVICIVSSATDKEIKEAKKDYVTLIHLPNAQHNKLFTAVHGQAGLEELGMHPCRWTKYVRVVGRTDHPGEREEGSCHEAPKKVQRRT